MKNEIKIHLHYNDDTGRWDISLPSENKPRSTTIAGRQAKILKNAIDGDGILAASCKHYDQKTNGLIGLETY